MEWKAQAEHSDLADLRQRREFREANAAIISIAEYQRGGSYAKKKKTSRN